VVSAVPGRWRLRCQPPVLSPIPFSALTRSALAAARPGTGANTVLADLLRRDYAADGVLLTGSGTSALELAIRAATAVSGSAGPVALPAFGCYDLATAAIGAGVAVTLYDLDPATLGPDLDSLEAALQRGARVIVIAPLYGVPVDWDRLEAIAAGHGALLIEDAAQGHGASWNGRPLGSLGRLSVLSFGRGKGWTGGGGGALLWRNGAAPAVHALGRPGLTTGARSWVSATAQWALARPLAYGVPASIPWLGLGRTVYRAPSPATSPAHVTASIVLATRDAAIAEAGIRRERGELLRQRLPGSASPPLLLEGAAPGWLRLPVRLAGMEAGSVVRALHRLGVGASYPMTLADLPQLRPALATGTPNTWPGATMLVRSLVTLPTHSRLTPSDIDLLVLRFRAVATDTASDQLPTRPLTLS
jgi:perosamine synthetase